MLEKLPDIKNLLPSLESFKESKFVSAFFEAFRKARESKDSNVLKKIVIFAQSFFKEMNEVKEQKEKVSAETTEGVKGILGETAEDVKKSDELAASTKPQELETYVQFKGVLKESVAEAKAKSGLDKLTEAVSGKDVKPLEIAEALKLSGAGILTLGKLKERFKSEGELARALTIVEQVSSSSAYPLQRLLDQSVIKMLRPKSGGFTRAIEVARLCKSMQIPYTDAMKFGAEYMALAPGKKAGALKKFVLDHKKNFFPYTSRSKVISTLAALRKMRDDELNPASLAKLAFLVDDRDRKRLVGLILGKKKSPHKLAA